MKSRKIFVHKIKKEPVKVSADTSCDEMMEDVAATKVLYNWLYKQEEEDYYSSANHADLFPDFMDQEALFVE